MIKYYISKSKLENGTPVINLFDYDSNKLIKSFNDSDGIKFFSKMIN
jgi:hypothetical protein